MENKQYQEYHSGLLPKMEKKEEAGRIVTWGEMNKYDDYDDIDE